MKQLLMSAVLGSIVALIPLESKAVTLFSASFSGEQENPPVTSSASGTAQLSLNDAMDRLEMNIQLFGLDLDGNQTPGDPNDDVVALHIHRAPVGINGPVVFGLISPNSDTSVPPDLMIDPVAGTLFSAWDLAEGNNTTLADELVNLFSSGLYFNVHTPGNSSGEIRGQIVPIPEPSANMTALGLALFLGSAGLKALRQS